MKIEEFIENPTAAFIKAERYMNDGSRSNIRNTTSKDTCPLSECPSFTLKVLQFPDGFRVEDFEIEKDFFIPDKCIVIHPDLLANDALAHYEYQLLADINVVPTASGRTTLSLDDNIFIKLAYLEILGRIPRHISKEIIQSACEITRILKEIIDNKKVNSKFSILREDKGRVVYLPKGDTHYELGVLFREARPYPNKLEFENLIPFFSLFSKEYIPGSEWEPCEKQDDPLIIQLYQKQKQNRSLEDFALEDIIKPLLNTYFDALIYGGIELEAHAQNMLIAINRSYQVIQIVCRDLESAGRDITLMEHFNIEYKDIAKNYKYNTKEKNEVGDQYSKYQRTHSFMFDFKLGEYIITPIINCICRYDHKIDRVDFNNKIKIYNEAFIRQLPEDFFPQEWCDYEDRVWGGDVKKTYNWHENPKYRYPIGHAKSHK